MAWFKRIGLFLITNLLVLLTISLILQVFNIQPYLTKRGIHYQSLLLFCLLWGSVGSFISLMLSKASAKWMMGVRIIDPDTRDPSMRELVIAVHGLAREAGLKTMPEVGIYASPEVNAFATGPSRSNSLVAVSTGLLNRMDRRAVTGVLSHEVAHIANGDMVTMTLLQGVVNAFVMFLARAIAMLITRSGNEREGQSSSAMTYYAVVFVLEILFMVLGSMVVAWFSRYREFRADAGGARFAGRDTMIHALQSLQRSLNIEAPQSDEQASFQAFKISSRSSFLHLFSTHPPLEKRIAALQKG